MHRRKREEKYSLVSLFAFLVGRALNVPGQRIEHILELYGLELYQDRYRPAHVESLRRAKKERVQKHLADEMLLEKVGKMEVPESKLPPMPRKRSRRR